MPDIFGLHIPALIPALISYIYISPVILDISELWMPPMMLLHF